LLLNKVQAQETTNKKIQALKLSLTKATAKNKISYFQIEIKNL
jgi:hypothetical protein